ncbi:putative short chain alcohol dehydrogenase [Naematelia encephala]|uniref:Putative short chain alcohol dehydrogenase n=1 Tax=Naematelia encephala TaxID=71784 RepID=A0A1Y2BDE6_9TREE|nr:putative short chain alcohol dehydrogenase [Naematelia encephala]
MLEQVSTVCRSLLDWFLDKLNVVFHSGLPLFFWVRPRWSLLDMPDMSGKVVIVTGGNSGLGYVTCKALYDKGATVYMASRSAKKAHEAIGAIKKGGVFGVTGITYPKRNESNNAGRGRLEFLELDLADLESVEKAAEEFQHKESTLDVLFANAGVMASQEGLSTKQGYTLQFGTNCLGHHLLVSLLLTTLLATPHSRFISSTSAGHYAAPRGGVDLRSVIRDPKDPSNTKRGKYEHMKWIEYGQSKWGNIALAKWVHWAYGPEEGARKEKVESYDRSTGQIISIAIHPGLVATNIAQHLLLTPYILEFTLWLTPAIATSPGIGALNQLWAATCPVEEARRLSGEYIVPYQQIGRARPDLNNPERIVALWKWCDEQTRRHS